MVFPNFKGDLYHKYRPARFSEVIGHKEKISSIKNALMADEPSSSYLLTGDSGVGKTTLARIMAMSINCRNKGEDGEPCATCPPCESILNKKCMDVIEKNAADHRGIDAVREIASSMSFAPMTVDNKVYILDEFHQMTKDAQTSLLKVLEEAPKNCYIILCTTHPGNILPTVRNRCQRYDLKLLNKREIKSLVEEVVTFEARTYSKEIIEMISESGNGSPRLTLVNLQQVMNLDTVTKATVSSLLGFDTEDENVMKLVFSLDKSWSVVMKNYDSVKTMGAPAIGMIIAGTYRNKLIKGIGNINSYSKVLELFVVPFAEAKLGENQLVLALFKANQILKAK